MNTRKRLHGTDERFEELKKNCPCRCGRKCCNGLECKPENCFLLKMTDIIFAYTPSESNWLDKEWAKAKRTERIFNDIMYLEREYPNLTCEQKAKKIGINRQQYYYWKRKFNL